jgi:hypothetical protein
MEPQFEGQTKTKLGNSEVRGAVEAAVNEHLSIFLDENEARLIHTKPTYNCNFCEGIPDRCLTLAIRNQARGDRRRGPGRDTNHLKKQNVRELPQGWHVNA